MSGAIGATHIGSDNFNLITSEHRMTDHLSIKASPHHRGGSGQWSGLPRVENTMAEPEPRHCMEITLLNILRHRLHIKLLQLQSCVAPFCICNDLKRKEINTNTAIDIASVEIDTSL